MRGGLRQMLVLVAGAALTAVVAAGGFVLAIQPQRTKAASLAGSLAGARTELASLHARHGGAASSPQVTDLFRLARAMPDTDQMAGIVTELAGLAKASSLVLTSVRPAPRVALPDGSSALPLNVVVDGRWSGLVSFLRSLRRNVSLRDGSPVVAGRLFEVDSVHVQAGSQGAREMEAMLAMNAFDYGAPLSPTATAGAPGGSTTTTGPTSTTPAPTGSQHSPSASGSAG